VVGDEPDRRPRGVAPVEEVSELLGGEVQGFVSIIRQRLASR
jgi:hypothetical protein